MQKKLSKKQTFKYLKIIIKQSIQYKYGRIGQKFEQNEQIPNKIMRVLN